MDHFLIFVLDSLWVLSQDLAGKGFDTFESSLVQQIEIEHNVRISSLHFCVSGSTLVLYGFIHMGFYCPKILNRCSEIFLKRNLKTRVSFGSKVNELLYGIFI